MKKINFISLFATTALLACGETQFKTNTTSLGEDKENKDVTHIISPSTQEKAFAILEGNPLDILINNNASAFSSKVQLEKRHILQINGKGPSSKIDFFENRVQADSINIDDDGTYEVILNNNEKIILDLTVVPKVRLATQRNSYNLNSGDDVNVKVNFFAPLNAKLSWSFFDGNTQKEVTASNYKTVYTHSKGDSFQKGYSILKISSLGPQNTGSFSFNATSTYKSIKQEKSISIQMSVTAPAPPPVAKIPPVVVKAPAPACSSSTHIEYKWDGPYQQLCRDGKMGTVTYEMERNVSVNCRNERTYTRWILVMGTKAKSRQSRRTTPSNCLPRL